ncbi:MAG: hypothetical protein AAGF26_09220 [Cyanobacteria bacterium P01_G01_bin.49]
MNTNPIKPEVLEPNFTPLAEPNSLMNSPTINNLSAMDNSENLSNTIAGSIISGVFSTVNVWSYGLFSLVNIWSNRHIESKKIELQKEISLINIYVQREKAYLEYKSQMYAIDVEAAIRCEELRQKAIDEEMRRLEVTEELSKSRAISDDLSKKEDELFYLIISSINDLESDKIKLLVDMWSKCLDTSVEQGKLRSSLLQEFCKSISSSEQHQMSPSKQNQMSSSEQNQMPSSEQNQMPLLGQLQMPLPGQIQL